MTNTEKLVLLSIADHADQDGRCWPSIRLIASKCQLSERGVYKIIARLEQNGYLKRLTSGGGRDSTRYQLTAREELPLTQCHPTPEHGSGHPCTTFIPPLNGIQGTPEPGSGEPSSNRQGIAKEPPETGASALAPKRKRYEPTPEARELVHLFAQEYLAHTGVRYGVSERDAKHAQVLLAMAQMKSSEITDVIRRAWASKGWWGKRVRTLKAFVEHWNEIQAEVAMGPVSDVPRHVEVRRLEDRIARHPANYSWVKYDEKKVTPALREEFRNLKARLQALNDEEE